MFTGIIEEIGKIKALKPISGSIRITIDANIVTKYLKIDDSVSLNGACQTVIQKSDTEFTVEAVEETLRKSTLGKFRPGKMINLERAMRLGDRLGGHLVQGHIDCIGKVQTIQNEGTGKLLWIEFPPEFSKYVVPLGSICIDGVSLTVAKKENHRFMVSIIPHTWKMTTFNELRVGSEVNLEFDIIGKYIESLTEPYFNQSKSKQEKSYLEQYIDQPDL
ncbi:MAG: riboflavin synthase subunit alpha [Ignavibacteria bacterium GWB2_35_12]|nr:MAG: riboflavin synthase subunit alpha [Ignavibacteria bacterium GWA2_35_8]OGU40696.1 MAG: riboflavin synthase subunit alpha [Ignavibacteria bacterium GWB2_35_12]OGU93627.1 MAG: riboflavin synthase subunit alpha [Ignavibacteria bacterium RIFOXYA2_FULL_35_10]OGV22399.1 MAG: riboflavin synthase subunit alpha [Ignavibacteria bacterium RIFOXYC2_FULL_35_21]